VRSIARRSRLEEAFALRRNLQSLWTRRAEAHAHVDGMRALAVLWVIAYHTFAFVGRPLRHSAREPLFRVVNRGLLGVDVFFVLSGFLIGSMLLREHAAGGRISFRRFYFRRAMRILPAYYFSLVLYGAVIGKNMDTVWANLLFVNNFIPDARQCMSWAWSLAIEEQFYIVFPVMLAVAFTLLRVRLAFFLVLFALSVVVRSAIVARHGLHLPGPEHARLLYDTLYDKPHARFGELLSGVIVAYAFGYTKAPEVFRRSPRVALAGTTLALVCIAGISVVEQPFFKYGLPPSIDFAYYSLSAVVFAASVAYVLFACLCRAGGGGFIGSILAWKPFFPIGQLSYSAYLLHMIVILVGLEVGAFRAAETVLAMCAYLVVVPAVTLLASVPVYLFVERPFMNLREGSRS
jgi:peptidoglycan/LPS O-acetylase OafA/YrhL